MTIYSKYKLLAIILLTMYIITVITIFIHNKCYLTCLFNSSLDCNTYYSICKYFNIMEMLILFAAFFLICDLALCIAYVIEYNILSNYANLPHDTIIINQHVYGT